MYIKIDGETYKILENTYKATPKNIYSQAKRVKSPSLIMVKTLLGTVYEIQATIMNLNKETGNKLKKILIKSAFDVEFYDDYSNAYKTQSFYAPDTEMQIKRINEALDKIIYDDVNIVLTANQAANWVVN